MPERELRGTPASPGVALGSAWRWAEPAAPGTLVVPDERDAEQARALRALTAAADSLQELAAGLDGEEAAIVEIGAMMALDPALATAVSDAVCSDGLTAAAAILRATERYAETIAALDDTTLAARADDVRSLGRRAARLTDADAGIDRPPADELILIAHDVGPADVAELAPSLAAIALVGGGATAHAAIVARSLGIAMVTGLPPELLEVPGGVPIALDGVSGAVIVDPSPEVTSATYDRVVDERVAADRARADRHKPAVTIDGRTVAVLANVATRAELDAALARGAEGIGLLRTELAFLEARDWPSEQEHIGALEPILSGLGERRAVVRVLDFGADKSPPFLHGLRERGLELLLAHPEAFISQLRAIVRCRAPEDLVVLLPMVDSAQQVDEARALLHRAARESGPGRVPFLGSMIETPAAAANASEIAAHSDLLSIGTNDLTATTLGADRFALNQAATHNPRVLRLIASSISAAQAAGIPIEVCGEAASDPVMVPLLVGLGIDELSVGAAQVGVVRGLVRALDAGDVGRLAQSTLVMESAEDVKAAVLCHQRAVESDRGAAQVGL